MAEHHFTYTVSGYELSKVQKAEISQKIAAAVTSTLTGQDSETFKASYYLSNLQIYGGNLIGPDFGIATLQRALAEFQGLPQSRP